MCLDLNERSGAGLNYVLCLIVHFDKLTVNDNVELSIVGIEALDYNRCICRNGEGDERVISKLSATVMSLAGAADGKTLNC